jgi:hypothetical protein
MGFPTSAISMEQTFSPVPNRRDKNKPTLGITEGPFPYFIQRGGIKIIIQKGYENYFHSYFSMI